MAEAVAEASGAGVAAGATVAEASAAGGVTVTAAVAGAASAALVSVVFFSSLQAATERAATAMLATSNLRIMFDSLFGVPDVRFPHPRALADSKDDPVANRDYGPNR